jgi:membrane protease YdiL (CAAX protease family)
MTPVVPIKVELTRIPDSWKWMWPDLLERLLPFALVSGGIQLLWRPRWLGVSRGHVAPQLAFGAIAAPVLFVAAMVVKLFLARRRGVIKVPAGWDDATFQAGFYVVNGPLEEAVFRGLIQGGLAVAFGAPTGLFAGTASYVLYHHLAWPWPETWATALIGVPVAMAFLVLPGPPSLLGVSIAHIAATCGFLGPGPYLLKKLGFV